jgi:hypothetical protein
MIVERAEDGRGRTRRKRKVESEGRRVGWLSGSEAKNVARGVSPWNAERESGEPRQGRKIQEAF